MIRASALLVGLVLAAGCVSVSPEPSPTVGPTPAVIATPSPTVSPTPTPVIPTEPPTPQPTLAPTPTQRPTVPPTPTIQARPTATPIETPSADPTATATTSGNRLDPSAEPEYDTLEISTGFAPDPMTEPVVAGGPIDASYLNGGCSGFVDSAPDLAVRYTVAGFASLLRFYFEARDPGDATLVVREPDGDWLCNDDSYSSRNPTVDINNPAEGRYAIWIGSGKSGTSVPGTLSITELESNHP